MSAERRIEIVDWDKFQHYQKGEHPPWIKVYTRLLNDDDFMDLTEHQRSVLFHLWLSYATARRQLRDSTSSLSRRFGFRVMRRDLDALEQAGFIAFRLGGGYGEASESLALARRAKDTEVDTETKEPTTSRSRSKTTEAARPAEDTNVTNDEDGEEWGSDPEPPAEHERWNGEGDIPTLGAVVGQELEQLQQRWRS